jgi:hypothetical protein
MQSQRSRAGYQLPFTLQALPSEAVSGAAARDASLPVPSRGCSFGSLGTAGCRDANTPERRGTARDPGIYSMPQLAHCMKKALVTCCCFALVNLHWVSTACNSKALGCSRNAFISAMRRVPKT